MNRSETTRFWLPVAAAAIAIMLGCWLSSGTVAPYGTGEFGRCHYRSNGDHGHFQAVFMMLDGYPRANWIYSVVLRRILHPLLAFPLMKAFGFAAGGLMFNMLAHGVAMIALALALRRYFDRRAAVLACWLFASYPGYAYWAGLPYSYGFIVPGSIACTIGLLWWNDRPSVSRTAVAASLVGLVGLGYDLLPVFGGALLLLIAIKRRWRDLPIALVVLGAWALFIALGVPAIFGFPAKNSNTGTYATVVDTWLHFWEHLGGWGALVRDLPHVFVSNFFFSASVFLPALFLLVMVHHVRYRVRPILEPVPLAILLATFALWLFLNVAPPYDGWQMRGTRMARLYQPWFVVTLLVVARASVALRDTRRYRLLLAAVAMSSVLGWVTIAGPYVRIYALYMGVHQNFYQDWSLSRNWKWMHQLGVRPYGVCRR